MASNPDNSKITSVAQQTAEHAKVAEDQVISWEGDISDISCDVQLRKESHENPSKNELSEAKLLSINATLTDENKALKAELEKQKQQQQEKKYVSVDVFNLIVERIEKLENQQQIAKGAKRASVDENIPPSAEVPAKISKELSMPYKENYWDAAKCHEDIKISGDNHLTVEHKGNGIGWRSVFAKYSIQNCRSGIFYFEIKMLFMERFATIGFAIAYKKMPLDEAVGQKKGVSYGYQSDGTFRRSGAYPRTLNIMPNFLASAYGPAPDFSTGDVVGIGVVFANLELFFTKNGQRVDTTKCFLFSSAASVINYLFPCVSLWESDDKIEANFGPNFEFNLNTL